MGLRINNNVAALIAQRNMARSDQNLSRSLERLSSGLRINRAADDPAGLVISEQQRAQIAGFNQAVENSERGISMVQTAEGQLSEINALLIKMRGLVLDASNDAVNDANSLAADQAEIDDAIATIDRIAQTARFGAKILFDGSNENSVNITNTVGISGADSAYSTGIYDLAVSGWTAASYAIDATGAAAMNVETTAGTPAISGLTAGAHVLNVTVASAAAEITGTAAATTGLTITSTGAALAAAAQDLTAAAVNVSAAGTENKFGLTLSDGVTTLTEQITVADGDYATAATLQTALNNALTGSANFNGVVTATVSGADAAAVVTFNVVDDNAYNGTAYTLTINDGTAADVLNEMTGFTDGDNASGTDTNNNIDLTLVENGSSFAETLNIQGAAAGHVYTAANLVAQINTEIARNTNLNGKLIASESSGVITFTTRSEGTKQTITVSGNAAGDWVNTGGTGFTHGGAESTDTGTDGVIELDGYANTVDYVNYTTDTTKSIQDVSGNTLNIDMDSGANTGLRQGAGTLTVTQATGSITVDAGSAVSFTAGQAFAMANAAAESIDLTVSLTATGNGTDTLTVVDNSLVFQVGPNAGQTAKLSLADLSTSQLGTGLDAAYGGTNQFASVSELDVSSLAKANDSLDIVDAVITEISSMRGDIGSFQANTLESNLAALRVAAENLTAAESVIRDTDFSAEVAEFTKQQILTQAGASVLSNANQIPQVVLQLLR